MTFEEATKHLPENQRAAVAAALDALDVGVEQVKEPWVLAELSEARQKMIKAFDPDAPAREVS